MSYPMIRPTLIAGLLGLASFVAQAEEFRVGFVNTDRIFREANTAKAAGAKTGLPMALRENPNTSLDSQDSTMAKASTASA